MQQGAVGFGEFGGAVGQLADALGAQQLNQQRRACGVQAGHVIEVNVGTGVVFARELFSQLFQPGIIGQRPLATDYQPRRIT